MIYEIMYIVPSKFSDSEITTVQQTVDSLFKKHGAEIKKVENLGKLKFAYPIKTFTHGTYLLTYIEVEGTNVAAIDQELRLAPEVLRHLIVKREKGIPTFAYQMTAYQPPLSPEGKRMNKKGGVEKTTPVKLETVNDDATPEQIDEKLDEILDGAIVEDV